MGNLFGMFGNEKDENKLTDEQSIDEAKISDAGKLCLRKEELDIAKNRVQIGEVTLSKEVIEEQKRVDVPVTHEEVIIERRTVNNEHCDSPISAGETIRIPVSKEQIGVGKHTIITGEVSAHKRDVEETEAIEETLKREDARVNTTGDPNIVADELDNQLH